MVGVQNLEAERPRDFVAVRLNVPLFSRGSAFLLTLSGGT